MENTKILKSKLIELEEQVNSNSAYNIKFHQQDKDKRKHEFYRWQWKNRDTTISQRI